MKSFDPANARGILDGDVGYRWTLNRDFVDAKKVGGLSGSAQACLNMAIECFLVGYDDPAMQLLKRAFDWLTAAIKGQERPRAYGENGTEAQRHLDLAMCNWLLHNVHDVQNLKRFVEYEDRFLIGSKIGRDKTNVSITLVSYVDAGAYENALERFADAGRAPGSSSSVRNEGQMCYVVSRHRLGQEYSEAEVES